MIDMLNSRQKLAMPGKFQYLYGDTHRSYTFHHVQAKKENSTTDTTFKKGASHRHTIVSRKHIISSIPIEQDYRIISILGKGAFAKVYRAIHLATNEEVAVKISERKHLTTLRQRRNAEREVRIMTLLHHPNIIPVREVRVLADRYVIVMQQAHGGELFDHIIKCGRLTEIVARHYFRQIVSALRYCHEHSIIHRDLKPENVLLDETYTRAFIIDFGFGNTYRADNVINTFCGSPSYASPEMLCGVPYVGPEVDIWSLGVILYAMLTGRLPFPAKDGKQLCAQVSLGKFNIPEYVSTSAADLLTRMLHVDPCKRATMPEIIQHTWTMTGYSDPVARVHASQPLLVPNPNEDSVQQLISFGYKRENIFKYLRDTRLQHHPIISLYHLCEDDRLRRESLERHAQLENNRRIWQGRRTCSLVGQWTSFTSNCEGAIPIESITLNQPSSGTVRPSDQLATSIHQLGQLPLTVNRQQLSSTSQKIATTTSDNDDNNDDNDVIVVTRTKTKHSQYTSTPSPASSLVSPVSHHHYHHSCVSDEERELSYTPNLEPANDSGCASSNGHISEQSVLLALESIKDEQPLAETSVPLIHDYCRATAATATTTTTTTTTPITHGVNNDNNGLTITNHDTMINRVLLTTPPTTIIVATNTNTTTGSSDYSITMEATSQLGQLSVMSKPSHHSGVSVMMNTKCGHPTSISNDTFDWKDTKTSSSNLRQLLGQCQIWTPYLQLCRKMMNHAKRKRNSSKRIVVPPPPPLESYIAAVSPLSSAVPMSFTVYSRLPMATAE